MRTILTAALLAGLACGSLSSTVVAQNVVPQPNSVRVELASGEVLIGILVSHDGNELVLDHPRFGRLVIPKVDLLHPDQVPGPAAPSGVIDVPLPEPPPVEPSWKGMAELALTGNTGNTHQNNFMASVKGEHKTDELVKNYLVSFRRTEQDNADTDDPADPSHSVTEEKGQAEGRLTWPEADSPWRTFVQAALETDKFTAWDARVSAAVGRGYAWEDTEERFLEGRFGLGVSKEYGSADDDVVPEAVLGLDYRRNYTKAESFTASIDLFPSLDELGRYRAIARAAWEHKLADTSPWIFRIGFEDKYDRDAGTARRNDLAYFASLGYAF